MLEDFLGEVLTSCRHCIGVREGLRKHLKIGSCRATGPSGRLCALHHKLQRQIEADYGPLVTTGATIPAIDQHVQTVQPHGILWCTCSFLHNVFRAHFYIMFDFCQWIDKFSFNKK
jgi:hypothetical protein